MKTHSKTKKCFLVTARGLLKRSQVGLNHMLSKKKKSTKAKLAKKFYLTGRSLGCIRKKFCI